MRDDPLDQDTERLFDLAPIPPRGRCQIATEGGERCDRLDCGLRMQLPIWRHRALCSTHFAEVVSAYANVTVIRGS